MSARPGAQAIAERLLAIEGVFEGASIFASTDDERAYFANGKQIANFMDDETFEVRLTRPVIAAHRSRLKSDPGIVLKSGSDWVRIRLGGDHDVDLIAELAGLAAAAHRPPPGVAPKLPPAGADLARRRRFH
jgi:hypothetical protein